MKCWIAQAKGVAVLNAAPADAVALLAKGSSDYPRYVYQEASAALDPIRRIEAICARHGVPPGAGAAVLHARSADCVDDLRGAS